MFSMKFHTKISWSMIFVYHRRWRCHDFESGEEEPMIMAACACECWLAMGPNDPFLLAQKTTTVYRENFLVKNLGVCHQPPKLYANIFFTSSKWVLEDFHVFTCWSRIMGFRWICFVIGSLSTAFVPDTKECLSGKILLQVNTLVQEIASLKHLVDMYIYHLPGKFWWTKTFHESSWYKVVVEEFAKYRLADS